MHTPAPLPVVLVASVDPLARGAVVASLALDVPGVVVVSHDLHAGPEGAVLHSAVADSTGLHDETWRPLAHACPACAVREGLVPTLELLAEDPRHAAVVVALPVAGDPVTAAHVVMDGVRAGDCGRARLAGVVSALDPGTLVDDLFGDDLLDERGLALGASDRRAVGEALARQVESADLVALTQAADEVEDGLLARLSGTGWVAPYEQVGATTLLRRRLGVEELLDRTDPLRVRPPGPERGASCAWTLDLASSRPFHPGRLRERLEALGLGTFRARGHFWLASRPGTACVWDAAGGQLSIGATGSWDARRPSTRIVVTGVGEEFRLRVREAFHAALVTPEEWRAGPPAYGAHDDFGPWLDEVRPAA